LKGNKKLLVVAVLLLLIAVSYSTYAIYKTSVQAEATVEAAAWVIEFKDGQTEITSNYTIELSGTDCVNNHVLQGKIAPGAQCTKVITLDATGTEVDVAYTATAGTVTASSGETPVSTTGANAFSAVLTDGGTGVIEYDAANQTAELTLTVSWAGLDDSSASPEVINPADTSLQGTTITVPITLVAKQVPVASS